MIDQIALEEIIELTRERNKWENLFIDLIDQQNNTGFVHIVTPELSSDEAYLFTPDDLLPRVRLEVDIIDKQLISLGFQPSPLDLKEGESE